MIKVKVYGASDDLIEIESKQLGSDEIGCYGSTGRFITFSDGTVIHIAYGDEGVWEIKTIETGSAKSTFTKNKGSDSDQYTDIFEIEAESLTYKVSKRKLPAKRPGSTEKFIIVQLDDGGDLNKEEFDSREEADEYLEDNENKAYLIVASGEVRIEDHT
jgi:hypothetical protein